MSELIYKMATLDDIDELVRMRLAYIEADWGLEAIKDIEELQNKLAQYFQDNLNSTLFAFVAMDNQKMIATAFLLTIRIPPNPTALNGITSEVLNVYCDPHYRGKGIATRLMENLVDYAKENHYDRIDLSATKEGKPVYERVGFKVNESHYVAMRWKGNN